MRKSAFLILVAALLATGCATVTGPRPTPAPQPARAPEPQAPQARAPSTPPAVQAPRRPAAIRVDGRSLQAFRASWQRLRASLSPSQQTGLNDAVAAIALDGYGSVPGLPKNLRDNPILPEMIRDRLHGMTYAEIMALAREPASP